MNVFRINTGSDYKVQVVSNLNLIHAIADTGAKISVCGEVEAKRWNIYNKMTPSHVKIKPYKSSPIPVLGVVRSSVTFGSSSVPIIWHVIEGSCETILAGKVAEQLGIIKFQWKPTTFEPVHLIRTDNHSVKMSVQNILSSYKPGLLSHILTPIV